MKKWIWILLPLLLWACVGQKEDPEPEPGPGPDPVEEPETPATEGTRFFRRVLALEFTATWCQYCPNMAEALLQAAAERPGRLVEVAVHYADEMAPAESDGIVQLFKVSDFPSMVFDWDITTRFNQQDASRMTAYVDQVLEAGDAPCGLAVKSTLSDGQLTVDVRLKAASGGTYSVSAALVEDGILATQAGAGANYSCNSVLRGFLGAGMNGESAGTIKAGDEKTVSFTARPEASEHERRIVACALQDGHVVNVVSCPLNQEIDYAYEKDN